MVRPLLIAALVCALLVPAAGRASAPTPDRPAGAVAAKAKKKKNSKRRAKRRCTKKQRRAAAGKVRRRAACRKRRPPRRKRPVPAAPAPAPVVSEGGIGDATVVAVLDSGVNPYHFDFRSSRLPQHLDADPGNDLPLDRPFTEWLPGASDPGFAALDRVDLTLPDDPEEQAEALAQQDGRLTGVTASTPERLHAYWLPGTKVIGALAYDDDGMLFDGVDAHGVGTTSSAVGNLHGTCPECLLFFVNLGETPEEGEQAIDWVMRQPWIDAISNSYGYSLAVRDRVYSGSSTELQAQASERGQTVFFSAGNGNDGAFVAPNTTTYSSQEGPDWIVTVGAVSAPEDAYYDPIVDTSDSDGASASYTGAGKPADVAGIGERYPTAYTSATIGGTGESGFSGTSNATPQVVGYYARALYLARTAIPGPSRTQDGGVVAAGPPVSCGPVRPGCELADGRLTAAELRTRLLHAAVHTAAGFGAYTSGAVENPSAPPVGEEEFLNEGHGSFMGRVSVDRGAWLEEFERVIGPILGRAEALERPEGELEWMIVDSYCRQQNWGEWSQGYYVDGRTQLPGPDPSWPMRSAREQTCPGGAP